MVGRSLKATQAGIEKSKLALVNKALSQEKFAEKAGISRSTSMNFFSGKPVDRQFFVQICQILNLDWQEIADLPKPAEPEAGKTYNIDALVQEVRKRIKPRLQQRCGTMRVLDMNQSIGLDDIYTSVNILDKITGRRSVGLADLLREASSESFERFFLGNPRERVPGLEAVKQYSKLMILGKPGAGKTTFLKHLTLQCIEGIFQAERIPVFITLKDFAEIASQPSLLDYLIQLFIDYGIALDTKVRHSLLESVRNWNTDEAKRLLDETAVEYLLKKGKFFFLLDGLDEVRESDSYRVLNFLQNFADKFNCNQFVITCRIAAREYMFQQFTEVEVADFDAQQVADFSKKWFTFRNDKVKAEQFMQKLEAAPPIRELATSPLLLTLLCLVFEDSGAFPGNRAELYENGVDVLLKKWDVKRNIQRDEVYKKLSLKRKEDLLSQVAKLTFEAGNYFFKQREIERYITAYIQNLPDASTDSNALQLDGAAVLKSIEAQHGLFVERARGIYSFSHLTFHEYFTAHKIKEICNPYAADDPTLQALANRITEKRWREVILLTLAMLDSADCLLQMMKRQVDSLLAEDEKFQEFLDWVKRGYVNRFVSRVKARAEIGRRTHRASLRQGRKQIDSMLASSPEWASSIFWRYSGLPGKSP